MGSCVPSLLVVLMLVFTFCIARCRSQSIIYSITRCNSSQESKAMSSNSQMPTTTTDASNAEQTQQQESVAKEDGVELKLYVRSKRFTPNKMPRPPNLQHSNASWQESSDLKDSSKNISLVLAALLDDYDHNQRPGYGGPPAVITTNLEIRSMGPISELDMEYSLDCYFRQKWQDERLRFTGSASFLSLNIKMLDKIWKPDTYFHTGKGSHLHMITTPNKFLRIYKTGFILYSMRLTIKSLCPMDLHSFPMDKQSCPLILGSYGYPNDQLLYNWDKDPVTFSQKDAALSQFDIVKTIYTNGTFIFKRGNHSMLQVNFNLRRHVGYFLIQIYVPCSLIVVLSWVSFWINREATADRVGLGVTAVLTLSTFGLDSRNDLPRVSYATALDWYTIMCFLSVVFTLLEFAGVHYFTKVGTGEVPFIEIADDWTRSSSDENDTEEDERRPQVSSQVDRWKNAASKLKRSRVRQQQQLRNRRSKVKLKGRVPNVNATTYPTEYEMQYSNPNQNHLKNPDSNNGYKLSIIGNHLSAKSSIPADSYHMPFCPKNPDYQQYVDVCENEFKLEGSTAAPFDNRMSELENYVIKRLRYNSHINLVYPKDDYNPPLAYADSTVLKQTSSWPNLMWSDLAERSNLPWPMMANAPEVDDYQSSEESSELKHSNRMWNMGKSAIYSITLCCLQFWYCFTSNEEYKQEMKRRRPPGQGLAAVNSVSKIDKVSRIMFPLVFFVVNVFYWSFYINERNTDFQLGSYGMV